MRKLLISLMVRILTTNALLYHKWIQYHKKLLNWVRCHIKKILTVQWFMYVPNYAIVIIKNSIFLPYFNDFQSIIIKFLYGILLLTDIAHSIAIVSPSGKTEKFLIICFDVNPSPSTTSISKIRNRDNLFQ